MQVTSRRACLRIAAFTTFPLAYDMIRAWVHRHGHELVVVVTTPGPPKQRSVIYRDIVARAPCEQNILITCNMDRLAEIATSLRLDLIVSVNFPYRIPEDVIAVPRLAAVNLHPTPLPLYRGPNPLRMIYDGHHTVGATLHRIDSTFDTGPILSRQESPLPDNLTFERLWQVWSTVLLATFEEGVQRAIDGERGTPQDHSAATYAAVFTDANRVLDWSLTARELLCRSIAVNFFGPTARADVNGTCRVVKRLRIASGSHSNLPPGTVVKQLPEMAIIAVRDALVELVFTDHPTDGSSLSTDKPRPGPLN